MIIQNIHFYSTITIKEVQKATKKLSKSKVVGDDTNSTKFFNEI